MGLPRQLREALDGIHVGCNHWIDLIERAVTVQQRVNVQQRGIMRSVHADGRRHGMQRRLAREFGLDRALDHTRESTFSLRAVRLDLLGTHALAGGVRMLANSPLRFAGVCAGS